MLRTVLLAALFGAGTVAADPLVKTAEIALPGSTSRFDYQSIDPATGRLYLAHMGDGRLVVIDTAGGKVLADLPGFARLTGVLAVPEEKKVYASAAGTHEVVIVNGEDLETVARLKGAEFPDGIAYAPGERRIFVSDESGGADLVIDATADTVIRTVDLGGEAGNTRYDAARHRILVAVQTRNELVAIDPVSLEVSGRFPLTHARMPHGFLIDDARDRAYVSCEGNARLLVVDLASMQVLQDLPTSDGPDVLALDPGLGRLYVACESGSVDVFGTGGERPLEALGTFRASHAHSVSVDPRTHRVYVPVPDVGGRPMLLILEPARD